MSGLSDIIVKWTDDYASQVLAAPRMWGSFEAVEMQILQLLEVRALALRPQHELAYPGRVIDSYTAFLQGRFANQRSLPLFELMNELNLDEAQFTRLLEEFRAQMVGAVLPENPFEHSQLALKLSFKEGQVPSASAFAGYYEEFRRATRAAARKNRSHGRASKEIESATDFVLEDAVVTHPNGTAGQVLLRLGITKGQMDWDAEVQVREAISSMLTLAEWAQTGEPLSGLSLDDPRQRTRAALQARRLLPRRGLESVAIGGLFVARSKPVEFRASHEQRFLQVVIDSSGSTSTPFDQTGEIQAIDLDRGRVLLGKERVACFVLPEQLREVSEVGVPARVLGLRYQPLMGKPFVLADSLEAERSTNID